MQPRWALEQLLGDALPRLRRFVHARMGTGLRRHEESRDVVQSALGEAVRAWPRFAPRGPGSFLRWLLTLAEHKLRHRARDLHRSKRDRSRTLAIDTAVAATCAAGGPSPSDAAAGHELEQRYRHALAGLAQPDRMLIELFVERGCSQAEIAGALGLASAEAARKRIARAIARLEPRLGGRG